MSSPRDFRDMPISLPILTHTGKVDGDDVGYREVKASPFDATDPDPLVLADGFEIRPIYNIGRVPGLCPYYGKGIGGPPIILLRKPAVLALREVNEDLVPYGRGLLLLDGHRSSETQRRLFLDILFRLITKDELLDLMTTNVAEFLRICIAADDIGAYAPAVITSEYFNCKWKELDIAEFRGAARLLSLGTTEEAVRLYTHFQTNLGLTDLELDETGNTAHGSGGAIDAYLYDLETRKPTCLGIPFDAVGTPSRMDWFEDDNNFDEYVRFVADPKREDIREYLGYFDVTTPTMQDFIAIREERRMLFHAMTKAGATIYINEAWHFNLGNERGGKQSLIFPGGGNSCHGLLRDVRDDKGDLVNVWTNGVGNQLAREFLAGVNAR